MCSMIRFSKHSLHVYICTHMYVYIYAHTHMYVLISIACTISKDAHQGANTGFSEMGFRAVTPKPCSLLRGE